MVVNEDSFRILAMGDVCDDFPGAIKKFKDLHMHPKAGPFSFAVAFWTSTTCAYPTAEALTTFPVPLYLLHALPALLTPAAPSSGSNFFPLTGDFATLRFGALQLCFAAFRRMDRAEHLRFLNFARELERPVDVFCTLHAPACFVGAAAGEAKGEGGNKEAEAGGEEEETEYVTQMSLQLSPRYHFASSAAHPDLFLSPPPFRGSRGTPSRFFHLARFGGSARALYAAVVARAAARGGGASLAPCPLRVPAKRRARAAWAAHSSPLKAEECWFCPKSPHFDRRFVARRRGGVLVAADKAPLTAPHALLMPARHAHCIAALPEGERGELLGRWKEFREAQGVEAAVFVERSLGARLGKHALAQTVALAVDEAEALERALPGRVEAACGRRNVVEECRSLGDFYRLEILAQENMAYFAYEIAIHGVPRGCRFVLIYPKERAKPQHVVGLPGVLAREAIAHAVGKPELIDWKACSVDGNAEIAALVEELQGVFPGEDPPAAAAADATATAADTFVGEEDAEEGAVEEEKKRKKKRQKREEKKEEKKEEKVEKVG